jgi:hypothetical protein
VSPTTTPRRPADRRRSARPLALVLMRFVAFTLAVFATLHLAGVLRVGSASKPSYGAGVAEALICVVLLGGSLAPSRRAALSALGFAIFGFLVGLSFTLGGGEAIDLVYHAVTLPVLMATAALVALPGRASGPVHNSQKLT